MILKNDVISYILFQRTGYLRHAGGLVFRVLRKILPFVDYKFLVAFEAKHYARDIAATYERDMEEEFLSLERHLPSKCGSILDIGCGIGGIDILLYHHYGESNPDLYLLDKSLVNDSIYYEYEDEGAFYNSLDLAKNTLVENGVPSDQIHLLEVTDDASIEVENVDLVISILSWGFHYPVELYLQQVWECLTLGGQVIIDIRKGTTGLDEIRGKFGDVEILFDGKKRWRVKATKAAVE